LHCEEKEETLRERERERERERIVFTFAHNSNSDMSREVNYALRITNLELQTWILATEIGTSSRFWS